MKGGRLLLQNLANSLGHWQLEAVTKLFIRHPAPGCEVHPCSEQAVPEERHGPGVLVTRGRSLPGPSSHLLQSRLRPQPQQRGGTIHEVGF